MNLTLKALQEGKKKCDDMKGLENLMTVAERTEIMESIENLSVSFSQCIGIIEKVSEVKDSLEKFGYTDEWYDSVFSVSGLENIVEFDIPKFTTYGTKQEACMEGFIDTIKDWLKKAWNILKDILVKIYRFIVSALKKLNLNTKQKIWMFDQASKKLDDISKSQDEKMKQALVDIGLDLESFYDIDFIDKQQDDLNTLLDILNDDTISEEVGTYVKNQNEFVTADRVRRMFGDLLKGRLDAEGIKYTDANKDTFTVKVNPAVNHMVYFYGKQIGKQFPQTKLDIDDINKLFSVGNSVKAMCARLDSGEVLFTNLFSKLQQQHDTQKSSVDMLANTPGSDPVAYSECHAKMIVSSCLVDIASGVINYFSEVISIGCKNMDLCIGAANFVNELAKKNKPNP